MHKEIKQLNAESLGSLLRLTLIEHIMSRIHQITHLHTSNNFALMV